MVDARSLLDGLLKAGGELAAQGKDLAERGLGLPQQGPEREAAVSGLQKGALGGGLLGLLLGSKSGRSLAGNALAVGGLAALGGVAYKAYRNWQAAQAAETSAVPPPAPAGTPVDQMQGPPAQARSEALLRAMIAAAKADGHMDAVERSRITQQMQRLSPDGQWAAFLLAEIDKPLTAEDVALGADSPEAAAEIYAASLLVIDLDHPQERSYLDRLAAALGMAPGLVQELEAEVRKGA